MADTKKTPWEEVKEELKNTIETNLKKNKNGMLPVILGLPELSEKETEKKIKIVEGIIERMLTKAHKTNVITYILENSNSLAEFWFLTMTAQRLDSAGEGPESRKKIEAMLFITAMKLGIKL